MCKIHHFGSNDTQCAACDFGKCHWMCEEKEKKVKNATKHVHKGHTNSTQPIRFGMNILWFYIGIVYLDVFYCLVT
jgi:hypothetical protein